MMISTRGRYALRVLVDMAEHQSSGYVPLKEIADRQEISEKYLESIVKALVKEGVLIGLRGKGGGYRLSKAPDQFVVGDILRLMEGTLAPVACLDKDSPPCKRMVGCRTLPLWQGLDQVITEYLDKFTLEDLMAKDNVEYDYII
ncbi:MAG: Rrf2 family transcriptional regulator [Oscillospiraceae bacterium]|nr:Rrf2 family transcriptional regulator [Oscillospiraceae bacterium]